MKPIEGSLSFFETSDGLKTAGFLLRGTKDTVVVFVHGMGGNFYKQGFLYGARELFKKGISFFSFNTRGAEIIKDFRDLEGNHHLLGTAFENFEESTWDIQAAIEYLESLGYKDIHLMGHSTGCQKMLYYAYKSVDDRVKSLIHLSPAEDYEIWKNSLGSEFEKFLSLARQMVEEGRDNEIILPLYEKTGEFWSAHRFLSFASRDNLEAKMFNYEELHIFSKVKLPTMVVLGKEDPYFPKGVGWYAERLKHAYRGERIEIVIMEGDHSFHGFEKELFKNIGDFVSSVR